jgi:hypothetical protein
LRCKSMDLQRINWKLFFELKGELDVLDFFKVFNRFIPGSPEVFIDPVDYQHVVHGPKVHLAGHYVSLTVEQYEGAYDLLYMRTKQMSETSNLSKLKVTFKEFLKRCEEMASSPELSGKLHFRTDRFQFQIGDRGIAPNTAETYKAIQSDIESFAALIGAKSRYASELDKRGLFTVHVEGTALKSISELSSNI